MFKNVICLSVTYMYVYCLEKSLAASGVYYMGRSGNTPLRALTDMFCWSSPHFRGLCINEPTSAPMHNKLPPQGSIFLHMITVSRHFFKFFRYYDFIIYFYNQFYKLTSYIYTCTYRVPVHIHVLVI